ncbi:hypothetical protein BaRGS_00035953 [Batillaria attramentaria]|uniref:Transmembrane protein n=1 Tax=Batillaria attramentaria TaxID=370345 RepID=A0ABD0JD63_9CAEN
MADQEGGASADPNQAAARMSPARCRGRRSGRRLRPILEETELKGSQGSECSQALGVGGEAEETEGRSEDRKDDEVCGKISSPAQKREHDSGASKAAVFTGARTGQQTDVPGRQEHCGSSVDPPASRRLDVQTSTVAASPSGILLTQNKALSTSSEAAERGRSTTAGSGDAETDRRSVDKEGGKLEHTQKEEEERGENKADDNREMARTKTTSDSKRARVTVKKRVRFAGKTTVFVPSQESQLLTEDELSKQSVPLDEAPDQARDNTDKQCSSRELQHVVDTDMLDVHTQTRAGDTFTPQPAASQKSLEHGEDSGEQGGTEVRVAVKQQADNIEQSQSQGQAQAEYMLPQGVVEEQSTDDVMIQQGVEQDMPHHVHQQERIARIDTSLEKLASQGRVLVHRPTGQVHQQQHVQHEHQEGSVPTQQPPVQFQHITRIEVRRGLRDPHTQQLVCPGLFVSRCGVPLSPNSRMESARRQEEVLCHTCQAKKDMSDTFTFKQVLTVARLIYFPMWCVMLVPTLVAMAFCAFVLVPVIRVYFYIRRQIALFMYSCSEICEGIVHFFVFVTFWCVVLILPPQIVAITEIGQRALSCAKSFLLRQLQSVLHLVQSLWNFVQLPRTVFTLLYTNTTNLLWKIRQQVLDSYITIKRFVVGFKWLLRLLIRLALRAAYDAVLFRVAAPLRKLHSVLYPTWYLTKVIFLHVVLRLSLRLTSKILGSVLAIGAVFRCMWRRS